MKIHKIFFYLLVLLLPVQLGKHFWPEWTLVNGLRIDYLSPTVYLTDLLVVGIFMAWFFENKKKLKTKPQNLKLIIFSFLTCFLLINVYLSANQLAALYKFIKIMEFGFLGYYLIRQASSLFPTAYSLLAVPLVYSSLIAIAQFLNQASLGGFFWFLGERAFSAATPGIALAVISNRLLLRPYATFSHPNVLAGFLVVTLPFLIFLKPQLRPLPLFFGLIALFLTFSRVAWFALGFSFFLYGLWFLKKFDWAKVFRHWSLIGLLVSLILISSLFFFPVGAGWRSLTEIQPESIQYRQALNQAALQMIRTSPFFGVGLGNFLVRLPDFYQEKGPVRFFQPAHNLYLMIAAETVIMGLTIFLSLLFFTFKKLIKNFSFKSFVILNSLLVILFLSFFDHYFYTLQQGQLLLTLILGFAFSSSSQK